MKRFMALVLAAFMVCSAFMFPASAVRSKEYEGSDPLPPIVDIPDEPVPETPGEVPEEPVPGAPGEAPEEPVEIPEEPVPMAPQTGYDMGINGLMAAAVVCGAVAVAAGKKAAAR